MKTRILFVGHTGRNSEPYSDPSTRYRCFKPAAALTRRGFSTAVVTQSNFEQNLSMAENYDYFVFHRPTLTEKLAPFLYDMKNSPRIIADFDDLIFDVQSAHLTPAYRFRGQSISQVAKYLADNAAACSLFDRFSASTTPLTEKMRDLFGATKAIVTSNSVEPSFVEVASFIRSQNNGARRPYKFGYFSGTATHDADFESIAPSLAQAFDAWPSARMLVLGPATIPQSLIPYMDQIDQRHAVVPFDQLPFAMAQVEVVIAPLEWNDFTICKSGLKFFEAALVGCCVAATPIPDIDRFNSPMLRKCNTEDEWNAALAEPFDLDFLDIENEISKMLSLVDADKIASVWEAEFFQ